MRTNKKLDCLLGYTTVYHSEYCRKGACDTCGWNPVVSKRRLAMIRNGNLVGRRLKHLRIKSGGNK